MDEDELLEEVIEEDCEETESSLEFLTLSVFIFLHEEALSLLDLTSSQKAFLRLI